MSTLPQIREKIDDLQKGDSRAVGNEPTVDDTLDLLRQICEQVARLEEAVRDLERRFE